MNLRHLYLSTAMVITMATGAIGQQVGLRPPLPQNNTPPTTQNIVVKIGNINYKLQQTTTPNGGTIVSSMVRNSNRELEPETTLRFGPDSTFLGADATLFGSKVSTDYSDPTTPTLFAVHDVSEELGGFLEAAQKANKFGGSKATLTWQIGPDGKLIKNQSPELEISFADQNKKGEWQEKANVKILLERDGTEKFGPYAATLQSAFKDAGRKYPAALVNDVLAGLYTQATIIAQNKGLWLQTKKNIEDVLALMGQAPLSMKFANFINNATAAINGMEAFQQNKHMADSQIQTNVDGYTYKVTSDKGKANSIVTRYALNNPKDKGQEVGWLSKNRQEKVTILEIGNPDTGIYLQQQIANSVVIGTRTTQNGQELKNLPASALEMQQRVTVSLLHAMDQPLKTAPDKKQDITPSKPK